MAVTFGPATRNITRWDKPKVNYIGITKNGNTSMKHHLYQIEFGKQLSGNALDIHGGRSTKEIQLVEANANGYQNIAVVRHPFTRFISMWKDMCVTRPERGRKAGIKDHWTPNQLIDWILEQEVMDLDVHFLPQYVFTDHVNDLVLLKMEEKNTWSDILKDIAYDLRPVIHKNETDVEIDPTYINDNLHDKVYKMYHRDYELYGYKPDVIVKPDPEQLPDVIDTKEWYAKGADFINQIQRDKVLLVGSGRSATEIKEWELDGWSLVTINHAYQIRDDWEFAGYAGDFPRNDRPIPKPPKSYTFSHREGPTGRGELLDKIEKRSYENAMAKFGKKHMTMFFNATYWALVYLQPKVIGFMGCDMNYQAETGQPTHFYGVGKDIQKRGVPDPDKFINQHYKGQKEAMSVLFKELETDATNLGCKLVNFSKEESRLPYDKADWHTFKL